MCTLCNFMFHRNRRVDERGFTVVELAVVLLVIAIIAAFTIPQVLNYMRAYKLGVAGRNIATALQRARYIATSNNTRAGVAIAQAHRIDIEQYDPEGKAEPQNKGAVLLPNEIRIATPTPIKIAFDGRGVVTPLPKESQIIRVDGAGDLFMTITVSVTGQVTVSDATQK